MTSRSAEFIILGAGPAGLTAALLLARRGREVIVLERAEQVGGLAASRLVAGQSADHGSHRLHPSADPRVLELLRQLLGSELQRRSRNGRIRLGGRWLRFPLAPGDVLRSAPKPFLLRAAAGAAAAAVRRRRADTFHEWVASGLGKPMGEAFYFPYARKIWGVEPQQLSGEAARRRISADTPGKLAAKLWKGRSGERGVFYYPAGGFGRIPEALAEAATAAGAVILTGTEAESAAVGEEGASVNCGDSTLRAARIWSTIPLPALARLADGPDGNGLRYRAMVLVYLVVPRNRYTSYDAHYFPEGRFPMTRVSEPKNYREGPDPADATVLCAEIPCFRGDETWRAPDGELAERTAEWLREGGLPEPRAVHCEAVRLPRAYPVYELGYQTRLRRMERWLAGRPRLLSFGRQGLFAHDNTHHAMAMAVAAAESVTADGAFDVERWESARRGFAEHIVED